MTLEALYAAMVEGDEENVWSLSLTRVTWGAQRLGDGGANLELGLRLDIEGGRSSTWTVQCTFVIDYRLDDESIDTLEHVTDPEHPLLGRYLDEYASLYFAGVAARPFEVIGALWEEHRTSCGRWTALDAHLRADAVVALQAGRGLLARGPRRVLERYARILEQHGMDPSVVGGQPFAEWRNGQWQPRAQPPEALLLGRSYVVADRFELTAGMSRRPR